MAEVDVAELAALIGFQLTGEQRRLLAGLLCDLQPASRAGDGNHPGWREGYDRLLETFR